MTLSQLVHENDPGKPEMSFFTVMKNLLVNPHKIISSYHEGHLPDKLIIRSSVWFLCLASVFFAVISVVNYPNTWHLTSIQLVLRFFVTWLIMGFFLIPLATVIWAILQRYAAWFFNVEISIWQILGIAGFGIFYYALIFLLGIPCAIFEPASPFAIQGILFALNLSAFILSIRLFKHAYAIFGGFSFGKSLLAAVFPIIVIILVYVATVLLSRFASFHHV